MGQVFDVTTGEVAVGDPTMGLARYPLAVGAYRLRPGALRRVVDSDTEARIRLDNPCVFALDATHLPAFEEWYHRVGDECSYRIHTLAARLPEFEAPAGVRVGFYWEHDIAARGREGDYVLDPAGIELATK